MLWLPSIWCATAKSVLWSQSAFANECTALQPGMMDLRAWTCMSGLGPVEVDKHANMLLSCNLNTALVGDVCYRSQSF